MIGFVTHQLCKMYTICWWTFGGVRVTFSWHSLTLAAPYHLHPALGSNILFKQKLKLCNAANTNTNTPYRIANTHPIYWKWRAVVNITYSLEPQILGSSNPFHLQGEGARTYHLPTVAMLFADNCTTCVKYKIQYKCIS